jgi:hypothetical protein
MLAQRDRIYVFDTTKFTIDEYINDTDFLVETWKFDNIHGLRGFWKAKIDFGAVRIY